MNILLENINTTLAKITECMARDPKRAERLLGDVKRWAGELAKAGTTLRAAGEPLFWYRPCRGGLYEGPHHNNSNLGKMLRDERPGEWVPLYAAPQASADPTRAMLEGKPLDSEFSKVLADNFDELCIRPAAEDSAKGAGDVVAWTNDAGDIEPISDAVKQARLDLYAKHYTRPLAFADRQQRGGDDFSGVQPPMRYIAGVNVDVLRRAALAIKKGKSNG